MFVKYSHIKYIAISNCCQSHISTKVPVRHHHFIARSTLFPVKNALLCDVVFISAAGREYNPAAAPEHLIHKHSLKIVLKLNIFLRASVWEVIIIRSVVPISLIIYYPKTEEGRENLAKRVSDVHASAITQRIKSLNCPTSQKLKLLDAIMEDVKRRSKRQT